MDLAAITQAVDELSPAQREYEEKRAAGKGMDLITHLGAKPSPLAVAVDDLIRSCSSKSAMPFLPSPGGRPEPWRFLAVMG
jgi:hypothetical protein